MSRIPESRSGWIQEPLVKFVRPFQRFVGREAAGGILLLACSIVALVWANSPWAGTYQQILHTPFTVGFGAFTLSHDLHYWVDDGLMTIFFFVVGLEIKRELLAGELASPRQAALPLIAALGGVAVPALLYFAINSGRPGAGGWGIPMATDIAFAIGVMALLGARVPLGLKVFLTALAIVDDIAAVLVIALFYTANLAWGPLYGAASCLLLAQAANRLGVRHPIPYVVIGAVLWFAVTQSGVHATIAGVLLAFMIPSRKVLDPSAFLKEGRAVLDHFEKASQTEPRHFLADLEQQTAIEALGEACDKIQPPLHRLEHALHPWVTFAIMPLFALANAGVHLSGGEKLIVQPITLGVIIGLMLGKPLGVTIAAWLAVRLGPASLPTNVSWRHIHGAGWLAGIGFTMSLFMAGLSFGDDTLLTEAKLGILTASLCAGIIGSIVLVRIKPKDQTETM
jgi:Na+:H+ antiporter, NhaA family